LKGWFSISKQKKSKKELDLIRFIIKQFGYRPKNLELFQRALTHKSISNITDGLSPNERLEFLGDAIFDAVVAEYLYERFPDQDEGYLTKVKAKIVSRNTLGQIGEQMELRSMINYQKGRAIKIATLEGNAFEALIGAIYLDSGYDIVKKIIIHHIFRLHLDLTNLLDKEIDFKSKLFIWCQKNKLELDFTVLKDEHKGGYWEYEVEAVINNRKYGKGTGESKKSAEQLASKETLILMGEL
jgi:ribonuclease-3